MTIVIYHYPGCSTCKRALTFLKTLGVKFEALNIVEQPPSKDELRSMQLALGGEVKKLFNTSGELYREMRLKDRLTSMSETELIDLLAANGKLIKRPFLTGDVQLLGFREDEWREQLRGRP